MAEPLYAEARSLVPRRFLGRFTRFAAAGGMGFVIEAVLLTWLVTGVGLNLYVGRAISFTTAVTATWAINRRFAFADLASNRKAREYAGYLAVQAAGALINLGVFVLVVAVWSWTKTVPVLPLAVGAGVALVFNFIASSLLVFQGSPDGAGDA